MKLHEATSADLNRVLKNRNSSENYKQLGRLMALQATRPELEEVWRLAREAWGFDHHLISYYRESHELWPNPSAELAKLSFEGCPLLVERMTDDARKRIFLRGAAFVRDPNWLFKAVGILIGETESILRKHCLGGMWDIRASNHSCGGYFQCYQLEIRRMMNGYVQPPMADYRWIFLDDPICRSRWSTHDEENDFLSWSWTPVQTPAS